MFKYESCWSTVMNMQDSRKYYFPLALPKEPTRGQTTGNQTDWRGINIRTGGGGRGSIKFIVTCRTHSSMAVKEIMQLYILIMQI